MLGKSDMNLFVKSKEECYFVNGLEVVSFHDIFTEIGVIYLFFLSFGQIIVKRREGEDKAYW